MFCRYGSNNAHLHVATMLNTICVGVFICGHMKCQMKPIPVSVTALVMKNYHCHGNRNLKFVCCGVFVSHYSLGYNRLTGTGAIVLATALQHNKSLEELK